MLKTLFIPIITLLILTGCQEDTPPETGIPSQAAEISNTATIKKSATTGGETTTTQKEEQTGTDKQPPAPPILEDFQGAPKLSLFPRVGDFQPPPDDERHPYWRTFIDHLVKVTGVAENADGSRGWVFRSINSIDSAGYFSPLAVEPNKSYQVSFNLSAELPEGASAGVGILEFDDFLWIGEQYTEETFKQHFRGVHEGKRLTGEVRGRQSFTFTTGPQTKMIHLVLFREGAHDRNSLMFDDIEIK